MQVQFGFINSDPDRVRAWRVVMRHRGRLRATSMGFAREVDAQAALAAMVAAGLDTPEKVVAADPEKRRRIMCEALAW